MFRITNKKILTKLFVLTLLNGISCTYAETMPTKMTFYNQLVASNYQ
ncbi:hypothetical protein BN59_01112 [Legionella massiliensis]|uniref:Uncharacterized protein n=1 Tax=Legionella massiliensis TaxID=1034943 RepID=A0A078KUX1_9GAMM|nr:hypothetical protein BN59_01112 [Legionella massiliensis]CEE12574.1 hypothetical protein BN1094_01112 [Legionella massiliensis]